MAKKVRELGDCGSTVVKMRKSYESNVETCLTSVVFLGDELGQKVQDKIIGPLSAIDPSQYFPPINSLHLTIKNVRTVGDPPLFDSTDAALAKQVFDRVLPSFHVFDFELKGLVRFPTSVSLMGYSDSVLYELVSALDSELKNAGVPDNKKYASEKVFFGNVTVCRFTSQPSEKFLAKIEEMRDLSIGTLKVKEVQLITGDIMCSAVSREVLGKYILQK
ncbi:TPA: hypothetical protein DEP86_00665 [Candidatus Uhrbacteria bacterium]|nr:hypothetical protein [Candidatus Uhrbacteria bacterium]